MVKLDNFVDMMTGHFNNKEQFDKMQKEGKIYPYAEHINTICNGKILNIPKILMVNLLLRKATMRQMGNVMLPRIFSLLQRGKMELYCLLMKYLKEKIRVHFHMVL